MPEPLTLERESQVSLQRLLPRLKKRFTAARRANPPAWKTFEGRLNVVFPRLFSLYYGLYHQHYDFFYHLEELLALAAHYWFDRSPELKTLDAQREAHPDWFQSQEMLGGVCYVDLFAGNLEGIRARIPYFKELGLTYLHLMPLFFSPEGENDGGYAVSSYRQVNPNLGTVQQLSQLAAALRQEGISLVVDFIFNHTSNDHLWARQALAGDADALDCYRTFPDRTLPDAYEKNLREIFPDEHPGAFSFEPRLGRWVWTTFHSFQWDLNYANPATFNRMAEEMLFLANLGIEILRLDAVAFIWKELGTSCENLPQAHQLIQAFNALCRIAAPAMLFKSEAIVHPDEVIRYISAEECQLSYNPLLMALLWNSLATYEVRMLRQALQDRFHLPPTTSWVNYVRCHDDIGWTFSDEDAARLGIHGADHRRFLNNFYTGRFPGSFARGLPFQFNPATGDCRISGTCASLAGLEKALYHETETSVALAIQRILLIHGIILTIGGIPLIYLGDELGTLNDYSYRDDPNKAGDSRWVHRPALDPKAFNQRNDPTTLAGRIYLRLQRLIRLRKEHPAFRNGAMDVIALDNPHILGYLRTGSHERLLVFGNFTDRSQSVPAETLRLYGLAYDFTDLLTGENVPFSDLSLQPYQFCCLAVTDNSG